MRIIGAPFADLSAHPHPATSAPIQPRNHCRAEPPPPAAAGLLLVAALVASFAMPAAAQWKWKDKSGQIQYNDLRRPPGRLKPTSCNAPACRRRAGAVATPASALPRHPAHRQDQRSRPRGQAQEGRAGRGSQEARRGREVAMASSTTAPRQSVQLKALDEGQRMSRINPTDRRAQPVDDKGTRRRGLSARAPVIASDCK